MPANSGLPSSACAPRASTFSLRRTGVAARLTARGLIFATPTAPCSNTSIALPTRFPAKAPTYSALFEQAQAGRESQNSREHRYGDGAAEQINAVQRVSQRVENALNPRHVGNLLVAFLEQTNEIVSADRTSA